jgi:hypothetical protein
MVAKYKVLTICFLAFAICQSCSKDESTTDPQLKKHFGKFRFTVVIEHWVLGRPNYYDTLIYNGIIRDYVTTDSDNYLFTQTDTLQNATGRLAIEFGSSHKITPVLKTNGELEPLNVIHYRHSGKFTSVDQIEFYVGGFGGLGGGVNYYVTGNRR